MKKREKLNLGFSLYEKIPYRVILEILEFIEYK